MSEIRARLSAAIADGPDPDGAPARLHRFLAACDDGPGLAACVPDDEAARLAAVLLAQSPALATSLYRDPLALARLASDPYLGREKPQAAMGAELDQALASDEDLHRALRRYVGREYLRLGARELGWGAADEVARELGALASVCLDRAQARAIAELAARHGAPLTDEGQRCRAAVIGMGKLGGEELNFSSDIDVIFLYETDAGAAGALTLHEFFSKAAERVVRALSDVTTSGMCFRVDLRLRPEGTQGPITNSLPALERYYESWGRPWERQAWIKARPVAGDAALGDEALRVLEPFVWSRSGAAGAIAAVHDLMGRIRAELSDGDDLKLGPGGIREVEFFVQALQLVHGARGRAVRERGTLRTLDKLLFAGLVSEHEHRLLGDAYVFLRRVEHRLQLEELRQTHAVPGDPERRALLARRLGHVTVDEFDAVLGRHRAEVSAIYATLGRADDSVPAPVLALTDPASDRATLVAALAALGFRDVESSADEIALLRRRPSSPLAPSATDRAARAAPILLEEIARSPDPDLALRHLVDLSSRRGAGSALWDLVAEHRPLGRLLMSLFGTSDFLAKIFVAHPEQVEPLVTLGRAARERTAADHALRIAERMVALTDEDEEARLNGLRRYRNEEVLRIGLYDVAGELDLDGVSAELSALADACLAATLDTIRPRLARRYGDAMRPLAVLGLGKLGGEEMTYSSDLDVVFVFDGDEGSFEAMSRLAQRLIHGLDAHMEEGRLYEIDTRLRPSGQRGALVSSLDGFRRYHQHDAALWERQALIKARVVVAGDAALGEAIARIAEHHIWDGPPLDERAAAEEIVRLRARMERELGREAPGRFNIKSGRGGLLDVEFLAQYLQLVHGPRDPRLRARATGKALDALHDAGILAEADHRQLAASYRFLRRLENRLRIVHDRSIAELSDDGGAGELDKLARRLGYHAGATAPGARLLDEYRAQSSSVRRIYARLLPGG